MNIELTPALIGFSGVVIGGILQAVVQLRLAKSARMRDLKAQAYLTFFQGIAGTSPELSKDERDKARQLVAQGRALVGLYGSKKVVKAMAASFRLEGDLHGAEAWPVHANMITAIREDASGQRIDLETGRSLFEVLYGSKE